MWRRAPSERMLFCTHEVGAGSCAWRNAACAEDGLRALGKALGAMAQAALEGWAPHGPQEGLLSGKGTRTGCAVARGWKR